MIICEGMDHTGKSTLCKRLMEEFNIPLIRRTGPAPKEDMEQRVVELLMSPRMEIHDRCSVLSEPVYGSVLRGGSIYGSENWEYIWLLLWKNPLIIYCRPPKETIFDFGDREQMDGVVTQKTQLLERYDELMNVVHFLMPSQENFIIYDWTVPGVLEGLITQARWYLMHRSIELRKMREAAWFYKHLIGVKQ